MEKRRKRMTKACLLTMLVVSVTGMQSLAEGGDTPFVPQTEQERVTEEQGSIHIKLTDGEEGTNKQNVVFSYAKVADWNDGTYEVTEQFSASGVDLEQIETAVQMEEAAFEFSTLMKEEDGSVMTDEQGETEISGLKTGVYLLTVKDQADYEEIVPFLVAVPTWNEYNKEMLYDIEVLPKHTPIPKEPEESVKTGDSSHGVIYGSLVALAVTWSMLIFRFRKKSQGI
ncbi:MAG: hypothetical protein KH359_10525 [Clostridiales bacterium]|nr:hypothetical protein [Clostridiales bacterium]